MVSFLPPPLQADSTSSLLILPPRAPTTHPHTFSVTNNHSQPQASLSLSTIPFHDLPRSHTTIPYTNSSVYRLFPVHSSQSIDYSQFEPVLGHIRPFPSQTKLPQSIDYSLPRPDPQSIDYSQFEHAWSHTTIPFTSLTRA